METSLIRQDLTRYRAELEKTKRQYDDLNGIVKHLESLLSYSTTAEVPAVRPTPAGTDAKERPDRALDFSIKGSMPFQEAVERAVREARGASIHVVEIYSRALALGARTNAANPLVVVQNACSNAHKRGKPIELTAKRTWRWIGPIEDTTPDQNSNHDNSEAEVTRAVTIMPGSRENLFTENPSRGMGNHA